MRNKILVHIVFLASLCYTFPASLHAQEQASGSFFGRARKAKTVNAQTPAVMAAPVAAKSPVSPQAGAPRGITLKEIEEKGLTPPPRIPGMEDYDISREIPVAPSGPLGPPQPNKGFIMRRSVVSRSEPEPPAAPQPVASAPAAAIQRPEPAVESPPRPAAIPSPSAQIPPASPQPLASAPRTPVSVPEIKKEVAIPRSRPGQSVQVPRPAPKGQVPTPKTPPPPSKRQY